ncbi:hypothetical protein GCM10010246_05230 [Streptomyces cuspidosporus]|uniref:Uncharacterized protein n=1 Tax=Streptomyces cuspidosporus TaxID=66882 RepID=A0ABP5S8D8_9ACTN
MPRPPWPSRRWTSWCAASYRGEDLDDEECAEIAVLASVAESAASRAAQEITTRALDVIGADAASARHGFDRF